jgi:parvulin-like peptidyl-prolyl isomerase
MAAAALLFLAQASLLASPLHLEEQPDGRAVRAIVVVHRDTPGASRSMQRSPDEARELAAQLARELEAGADFAALARQRSDHASSRYGGVLGTYWQGMLPPELDRFLFAAQMGELSGVIESPAAFYVAQRIERDVAWRQIQVAGTGPEARARCGELIERLKSGADFAELARAESADPISAPRGGIAGRFQRGPKDALLKAAAFEAAPGAIVGPVETPFALFVLQRIDPDDVDPSLTECVAVRVRAIRIAYTGAAGMPEGFQRSPEEAERIALDLAARIGAGEDMAQLARELDDDPGGREREGDLGWILRGGTRIPAPMEAVFQSEVGALSGPFTSNLGWVLYRREK